MEGLIINQMFYLSTGRVKNLAVQKSGAVQYRLLPLGTVEISLTTCCFECEGQQDFQVGEGIDFLIDTEDRSSNLRATIIWVARCEFLDEGYEHRVWFSYGAEFEGELDPGLFHHIAGDPKKSRPLGPECCFI